MKLQSEVKLKGEGEELAFRAVFDGRIREEKTGVLPYGFVEKDAPVTWPDAESTSLKTLQGKPVVRLDFRTPSQVGGFGKQLAAKGIRVYEMDIPYVRRILTDNIFTVDYTGCACFLDIEVDDKGGWKRAGEGIIKAVSVGDGSSIKTFLLDDERREAEFLRDVVAHLESGGKTVLAGWNVEFDLNHLRKRCERLGVAAEWLDYCCGFDMREEYMKTVKGLSSYSLEEVASYEKLPSKTSSKRIHEMSAAELEQYNRHDVELLQALNERYRFLDVRLELMREVNLLMSMCTMYQIGDTLILRRLRELGYVAPTLYEKRKEKYEGALVLQPQPGRYKDVVDVDVVSMYPTIIVTRKIDVGNLGGECVPYLVSMWMNKKLEAERRGDKTRKEVYKLLSNAMYGLFGFAGFRFYDKEKAAAVTEAGRKTIEAVIEELKRLGFKVIYGDTDGVFYVDEGFTSVPWIGEYLSTVLKPFKFEVDCCFKQLLMFASERQERGAKKRYAGLDTQGRLLVRGMELRRKDWCMLSKRALLAALQMIFEGKSRAEILAYYEQLKRDLFAGKFDSELVITKEVKEEYKANVPHKRAWEKAVELGLISDDVREVSYVWTKTGPEPYRPGLRIDYRRYWEGQLMAPLRRLLSCMETQTTLLSVIKQGDEIFKYGPVSISLDKTG
jgi:DNA polymerase elongation subunit (family B)